jgi:hypothetical protein
LAKPNAFAAKAVPVVWSPEWPSPSGTG